MFGYLDMYVAFLCLLFFRIGRTFEKLENKYCNGILLFVVLYNFFV